jgi:hypothetical protein
MQRVAGGLGRRGFGKFEFGLEVVAESSGSPEGTYRGTVAVAEFGQACVELRRLERLGVCVRASRW